ncbi:hypothetical protein UCRPC4_g05935 [Phaeomoniella chlamydospora]|uniref:BTB domain-containing protein n=1 Tax=Phaeomoniella chlamydospora TaxID=158046 RepID=A0A0G2E243_PHACM|nr:hypothetical protein UCRPC4_g05935 [Phaeomoniella chlamydospora]
MKESIQRRSQLKDVDTATFVKFVEYCYTGNYIASDDAAGAGSTSKEVGPSLAYGYCRCDIKNGQTFTCSREENGTLRHKGKGCQGILWNVMPQSTGLKGHLVSQERGLQKEFAKLDLDLTSTILTKSAQMQAIAVAAGPRSHMFTLHARLWAFATLYLVRPLQSLCIQKLHEDLIDFDLAKSSYQPVIDLISYAFSTGNDISSWAALADQANGLMDLKTLVIEYVHCMEVDLIRSPTFRELLKQGGEFVLRLSLRRHKLSE